MKILILYATHGGVTRACAQMLAEQLHVRHDVTLLDIKEKAPAPSDYEIVVLGSCVRMAKIDKGIKRYIKAHCDVLSNMPTAVFLCCGFTRNFPDYVDTQIPKQLQCSLGIHCFGGELKPEKLKGLDKLVVWIARNSIRTQDFEESDADHHDLPEIIPEHITLLEREIRKLSS